MYIRTLHLQSIKHIRDLTLSFERGAGDDAQPRMWTVLLGENGTGKTTILRTIAMLASGSEKAQELLGAANILALIPATNGDQTPTLSAGFAPKELAGEKPIIFYIDKDLLKITPKLNGEKQTNYIDPNPSAKGRRMNPWIGYGVARNIHNPKSSTKPIVAQIERVSSLFGKADLIGTNFYDHLHDESEVLAKDYLDTLNKIFEMILPRFKKIERGRSNEHFVLEGGARGVKLPATWLSQGEQATVSWIADMVGWIFWDQMRAVAPDQMRAVVLIDELDLHLHPTWQRALIPALKSTFPHVQFIVTTHSPLVLSGLEPDEIIRLDLNDEGEVVQVEQHDDPRLMTSAQLFQSFFGVSKARQDGLDEKLMRYSMLSTDAGRSHREDAELRSLKDELRALGAEPDWEPVPINPELRRED